MDAPPPHRRPRPPPSDAAAGLGTLYSLPPELLNEILSRLPLRCAVRTSAVARAWRRRWESIPSLCFQWDADVDPRAISSVLRRYSCPVRKFNHWRIRPAAFLHSDRWLRLLARRGVQTLNLNFEKRNEESTHTLHPSIFSCRELTDLELRRCDMPTMTPGFAGFPNLRELILFDVAFLDGAEDLEVLIAACPLLEKLCLMHLQVPYVDGGYHQWTIQAPKLRCLLVDGIHDHGWQIDDLPFLERAEIEVGIYSDDRDFVKLMIGLAHTKYLKFCMPPTGGNLFEGLENPFVNLKSLSLRTSVCLLSDVLSLFCLLRNAPILEVLDIELEDDYISDEVDSAFLNAQYTDDLFCNLIRVGLTHVTCKLSELRFVEFVLSKARQLRAFDVCLDEDCQKSNEDAVVELLKYRRASPRAKVFFSRADYD